MSDTETRVFEQVPSPFCGIASDDLKIAVDGLKVRVLENGDGVTLRGFETPLTDMRPRLHGEEVSLEAAVQHIAHRLVDSHFPLFSGFGTDVQEARAAFSLMDRCRGVFDQMRAEAGLRNLLVLSDSGWMVTTLAEVKNRVDVLVVFGSDIEAGFPRFFERIIWNQETLFGGNPSEREIIFLGSAPSGSEATAPDGRKPEVIPCKPEDLPRVAGVLSALAGGATLLDQAVGGIPMETLRGVVDRLRAASYGVVTWAAGQLDFPHAELTVQQIVKMVISINEVTRCAGLPLGGQDGDRTASQVAAWISGYPTRVGYLKGYPEFDPYHYGSARLLKEGEADLLVWVSSLSTEAPPQSDAPTVVIGRSGMVFSSEPEVFIPVGVPGIDSQGHMFRCDNVVALPLYQLRDSGLPRASEVLKAIERAMGPESS